MLGWKTIETRRHNRFRSLVGQTIVIHAAQQWDQSAYGEVMQEGWLSYAQLNRSDDFKLLRGVLLGTVKVISSRNLTPEDSEAALIECQTSRYGLFLVEPKLFANPIPCKGHQGIFEAEIP